MATMSMLWSMSMAMKNTWTISPNMAKSTKQSKNSYADKRNSSRTTSWSKNLTATTTTPIHSPTTSFQTPTRASTSSCSDLSKKTLPKRFRRRTSVTFRKRLIGSRKAVSHTLRIRSSVDRAGLFLPLGRLRVHILPSMEFWSLSPSSNLSTALTTDAMEAISTPHSTMSKMVIYLWLKNNIHIRVFKAHAKTTKETVSAQSPNTSTSTAPSANSKHPLLTAQPQWTSMPTGMASCSIIKVSSHLQNAAPNWTILSWL